MNSPAQGCGSTGSEELSALQAAQQQLDNERRRLSRLIGEHKKAGQPFDQLLAEMKIVSQKLREAEQRITDLSDTNQHNTMCADIEPSAPLTSALPQPTADTLDQENTTPFSIIRVEDDTWAEKWNAFVDRQPEASIYHRYEFRSLIETDFGQRCIYLAAINSAGDVVGVLPATQLRSRLFGNSLVSVPYFNYGGALSHTPNIATQLIQKLIDEARNCGASHIEMRDTAPRAHFPAKTEKVAMLLDLPSSPEQLWQDVGSKVRAQIKAAQTNNLRIVFGKTELLDDFYAVFAHNMRDLGTPVYAKRIFNSLLSCTTLTSVLAVVYHDRKPVSCAFLLGYRQQLEIPWASTLQSANKLNANMFMYWQVLRFAIEQNYHCFDFGRSSKGAGTYKFKKQWGAKPRQLYWHYWLAAGEQLPQMNPNNPKYRLMIAIWKRLPVFITRLIGPPIVENLPVTYSAR